MAVLIASGYEWSAEALNDTTLVSLLVLDNAGEIEALIATTDDGRRLQLTLAVHKGYVQEFDSREYQEYRGARDWLNEEELLTSSRRLIALSCARPDCAIMTIELEQMTVRFHEVDPDDQFTFGVTVSGDEEFD